MLSYGREMKKTRFEFAFKRNVLGKEYGYAQILEPKIVMVRK